MWRQLYAKSLTEASRILTNALCEYFMITDTHLHLKFLINLGNIALPVTASDMKPTRKTYMRLLSEF